jgi:hypothetical protein
MNRMLKWAWFAFLLAAPLGFAQDSKPTVNVLEAEAAEHRIGARGPIYTNFDQEQLLAQHVAATFEVVVGTDGKAVCATATEFFGDLTLLCKTWEYKPFERNGRLDVATVRESVAILPIGQRSEVHVPFPEIHDWNSLRITLSRSPCYGTCSTYEIEIQGDGTMSYDGKEYVGTTGRKAAKMSRASLMKLVDVFRKADYFSLADGYVSGQTDSATCVTSISFDGQSKSVLDYVGRTVGMPPGVSDLEVAIDKLSGASKWIRRK